MSFKQDGKKQHKWYKWLDAHRCELLECGVPDTVLKTKLHWIRFLEDGCDYISGWFPKALSPSQAQALYSFICREYGNEEYRAFLRDIENMSHDKHTT